MDSFIFKDRHVQDEQDAKNARFLSDIQEKDMSEFITAEGKEILAKYDSVIAELVKILTPHIKKIIAAELTSDDQVIRDMIKAEVSEAFDRYDLDSQIESTIGVYDFDDIIESRCDDLGLLNKDEIEEMIKDHEPELDLDTYKFADAVKDVVRNMDISVEVN